MALVNLAGWALFGGAMRVREPSGAIAQALGRAARPVTLVVGDYYIFGEYEDRIFLKRLIRDFSVNSREDLVERVQAEPRQYERYADVALQYLPSSAAFAIADLAPVLAGREVRVVLASEVTPQALKSGDVVYVGLLSGLGPLKEAVFAGSRFSLGESYDVILDEVTHARYASEAFLGAPGEDMYRDFGLFSTFAGPSGNRIVVLAGARDTALMGVAEAVMRPGGLTLEGSGSDREALFEVKGQKHVNLEARIVASGKVDAASAWSVERIAKAFPAE